MLPLLKNLIFTLLILTCITALNAKPWLGITVMEPEDAEYGVKIFSVDKDSPADKAGMEIGDRLIKINGEKIYTTDQLKKMIESKQIGDKLKIELIRDKEDVVLISTLEEKQIPKKPFLGVVVNELDKEQQEEMNLDYGLYVNRIVEDSSAEKANLKKGDILLSIDNDKIYTPGQLRKILNTHKPDSEITVKYLRDGKEKNIKVKLGSKSASLGQIDGNVLNYDFSVMPDKVTVLKYDDNFDRLGMKIEEVKGEVIVKAVEENSDADKAGIRKGDKIISVNREKIKSIKMIDGILNERKENEVVEITVLSGGKKKTLELTVGPKKAEKTFDLSIDDDGIRFIIDGKETELFNEDAIPKIKEFFKDLHIDEWMDELKDNLPEEKDIDLFFKKQVNKEQV